MKRKTLIMGGHVVPAIVADLRSSEADTIIMIDGGHLTDGILTDEEIEQIKADDFLDFCGGIAADAMRDRLTPDHAIFKDPGPRWNSNGKAKKRPFEGSSR